MLCEAVKWEKIPPASGIAGLLKKTVWPCEPGSYLSRTVGVFSSKINTSSIFTPKYREILKARSREGIYFSFSMARMVCRLTPITCARCSWVRLCTALNTLILFFISLKIPVFFRIIDPETDIQEDHQAEKSQLDISHHSRRKNICRTRSGGRAGECRDTENFHHGSNRECTEYDPEDLHCCLL